MTTPNKIDANRKNALKSTGPRTPEGKAIVSQNSARAGLFAAGSVLPGLESRARWHQHLQATIDNLAPLGQVECALAERVALILWRLCRVSAFEQDTTHQARVRSYDETLAKRQPIFAIKGVDTINDILQRLTHARARLRALQRLATSAPGTLLSGRHADLALTAIAEQLDDFDLDTFSAPEIVPDDTAWADIPHWTVDRLRRLVDAIAQATEQDPEHLIAAATDAARDAVNRERIAQRTFERQVRDLRAERLLPEPANLDRLTRYERHLTQQLDQTLKQLHALQHARRANTNQDTSASPHPPEDAAAPFLPFWGRYRWGR